MKDQTLCAWGHTGTRSQPWRWGEHPAAPTDETLSVQQGLALTLQPTPTLDLWTQPGPRNDEVTLWEPGSVSVTCEHNPPGNWYRVSASDAQGPAQNQEGSKVVPAGRGGHPAGLLLCVCTCGRSPEKPRRRVPVWGVAVRHREGRASNPGSSEAL